MMTELAGGRCSLSDVELVSAARTGDQRAFADLVDRYRNIVFRVAYKRIGDFGLSEDIAQQTFVTAWKRNLDLAQPSSIVGWLCGIAGNLVRNELRNNARHPRQTVDDRCVSQRVELPEAQAISREENDLLWSTLERIPLIYREPMILYYREDASTGEIAATQGISEEVVRQRLARGRKLLERHLVRFGEQYVSRKTTSNKLARSVLIAVPGSSPHEPTILSGLVMKIATAVGAAVGALKFVTAAFAIGVSLPGLMGGFLGTWNDLNNATSDIERRFIWRGATVYCTFCFGFLLLLPATHLGLYFWWPTMMPHATTLFFLVYLPLHHGLGASFQRQHNFIKLQYGTPKEQEVARQQLFQRVRMSRSSIIGMLVGGVGGSSAWMFFFALMHRDWFGLLLLTMLVIAVSRWSYYKVSEYKTQREQYRTYMQLIAVILLLNIFMVTVRWPVWFDWTKFH